MNIPEEYRCAGYTVDQPLDVFFWDIACGSLNIASYLQWLDDHSYSNNNVWSLRKRHQKQVKRYNLEIQ